MSRNRIVTALQKTYDDSYLSCSTAVFYEGQGNEIEATRYWKNALDRICDHHKAQPSPTSHHDHEDIVHSLFEAIKELELQCRERIDLLEALRASRQYESRNDPTTMFLNSTDDEGSISTPGSKFIGQGTIPAVTYSELSRPILPHRHSPSPRRSSEHSRLSLHRPSLDATSRRGSCPGTPSHNSGPKPGRSSRPSSPEKHSMKTTLRSGRAIEKTRPSPQTPTTNGEGPSKAATLAWNAFGSRDFSNLSPLHDAPSSSSSASRKLAEQVLRSRKSPSQWDAQSRTRFFKGEAETPSGKSRQAGEYCTSNPSLISVSAATNALAGSSANSEPLLLDKTLSPLSSNRVSGSSLFGASFTSTGPCKGEPLDIPSDSNLIALPERRNNSGTRLRSALVRETNDRSELFHSDPTQQSRDRCDECTKSPCLRPAQYDQSRVHTGQRRRSSHHRKYSLDARRDEVGQAERPGQEGEPEEVRSKSSWTQRKTQIMSSLSPGVDEDAAKQILNEIVVQGDEVRWGDIAGLEIAKNALREAVVYPFLRPDLFMGLREPARGMLLFGPPGTGKTMLARAVATESRSTFFSISASSLTSKYLGESEKLVKALFSLARALAPSIIFVDEIDSLLSQRSGSGEHEATRRIKTEFLIQWSDLQRAAAGREMTEKDKERGDANRVLVLAATNMPWAIDEAARRRFVRRQYIPLPEATTRRTQLGTLLGQQKHNLSPDDLSRLVELTDGFSGSDITALAKDAAMGPLRSLGEALLHMTMDDIRPIEFVDFESSLSTIRPSVSKSGLEQYEDWAKQFGERGG